MNPLQRAPQGPWLKTLVLGLVLVVGAYAFLERALRAEGLQGSVARDHDLWAVNRDRVYGEDAFVIVGSSRVLLGMSPEVLEEAYPSVRVTNLAISGSTPIAVLEDLAEDPEFVGVMLLSLAPYHLLPRNKSQGDHVEHYHRVKENLGWLNRFANRVLASRAEERLVFRAPDVEVGPAFRWLLGGEKPELRPVTNYANGMRSVDYASMDYKKLRRKRMKRTKQLMKGRLKPVKLKVYERYVARIQAAVAKIQARGGKVAIVRAPTSGPLWKLDQKKFPRAKYWKSLEEGTTAETIHFKDLPELAELELGDHSHVFVEDVETMSLAFAGELERRGLLSR